MNLGFRISKDWAAPKCMICTQLGILQYGENIYRFAGTSLVDAINEVDGRCNLYQIGGESISDGPTNGVQHSFRYKMQKCKNVKLNGWPTGITLPVNYIFIIAE